MPGNNLETGFVFVESGREGAYVRVRVGVSEDDSVARRHIVAPATVLLRAVGSGSRIGVSRMSAGLVWRAVLFVGLTLGYVLIAALPYLA
jgi:hypothetical protein